MEQRKTWEEYSNEEKTTLLNHWVYYYGGIIMTLKDIEEFRLLSSTRQDELFNHIVTNYIFRNTIQSNMLLFFLREGKINELLNASVSINDFSPERRSVYEEVRNMIANELLDTFISPEPSIPMDIEIVIKKKL